jgi:multiple sugar transport system permease protein
MKYVYTLFSIVVALLFLLPFVWMIAVSLKPENTAIVDIMSWFKPPYTLEMYTNVLNSTPLMRWMYNSLIVAVFVTIFTLIANSMAAFALSKFNFRFKRFTFIFILAGLMVPGEATIIALYQTAKELNLLDSYQGLILTAIASPFAVIVLKSFFDGIPNEIMESAKIDGSGMFRIYYQIVLPLSKPALSAIAILTFIGSWNNFLWPFLSLTSQELFTLPMGIPTLMAQYSADYVKPMTINALVSIPMIIVFLIFEKQFVKGLSFTGIKG